MENRIKELELDLRRKGDELKRFDPVAGSASKFDEFRIRPQDNEGEVRGLKDQLRDRDNKLKEKEALELKLILELKEKENDLKMGARMQ
jgi:hypothetical protein